VEEKLRFQYEDVLLSFDLSSTLCWNIVNICVQLLWALYSLSLSFSCFVHKCHYAFIFTICTQVQTLF